MTGEQKVLAAADRILADIGRAKTALEIREKALAAEIERAKAVAAAGIETARAELEALEKDLKQLAAAQHAVLFADGDRCDLDHGSLLKKAGRKISWPKGERLKAVVAAILARGWAHLVKRPEPAVYRDEVEKLQESDVTALGLARKPYLAYEWEIKGVTR